MKTLALALALAAPALALPVGPVAAQPAARTACIPLPPIVRRNGFADSSDRFGPSSAVFRETVANFAVAYRRACGSGLLSGARLYRNISRRDQLLLRNAPDANVASLYPIGMERTGTSLQLEYPFVGHDGEANVPSTDDLHEAIYCYVRGATPREHEETGRCLPD